MHDRFKELAFVGVDTHKDEHTLCMTDCFSQSLGTFTVDNRPKHFKKLLSQIDKTARVYNLRPVFALEDVMGFGQHLARSLISNGYLIKEVNPIETDRSRRKNAHPEKSDPEDALAISKLLISKFDKLPVIHSLNELYLAIHQLSNSRDSLVKEQTKIKNKLHALLHREYPDYQKMFKDAFSKSSLAFWEKFPTPSLLKNTSVEKLAKYLRTHSNNTVSTAKASAALKIVGKTKTPSCLNTTNGFLIKGLVKQLKFIKEQIDEVEQNMQPLVKQTGLKLETLTGVHIVTSAKLIAEIGDINRFASSSKLARCAGIAPTQKSSGKKKKFKKSNRGRRQLNAAFYRIALSQIARTKNKQPKNAKAREYFLRKISEGKTKKEALTCLQRRLCDIVYAMMKNKTEYRP
jgi:transposase